MVSVKRRYRAGIILVLASYLVFLAWDKRSSIASESQNAIVTHKGRHLAAQSPDALIIGGSNAFYSLSAEQLSKATGLAWYNAALINEGFSMENYAAFLQESISSAKRSKVQLVVYSPIDLRQARMRKFSGGYTIFGQPKNYNPLPKMSLAATLKKAWLEKADNSFIPLPDENGDFNFENFMCIKASTQFVIGSPSLKDVHEQMTLRLGVLHDIFPSAMIVTASPSIMSDQNSTRALASTHGRTTESAFIALVGERLINEPDYKENDMICDEAHHANKAGRSWRTSNAIQLLLPYLRHRELRRLATQIRP